MINTFVIFPSNSAEKCPKLKNSVHDQILQWWKKVAVQKPLNCAMNHEYSKPYPEKIVNNFFQGTLNFLVQFHIF